MGQFVEIKVKIKSESDSVPDFGLGKGVLVTQRAKLDDDDSVAGLQIANMSDKLLEELMEVVVISITEEDYNKDDDIIAEGFKVGDPVEIIGNIPFQLKNKPKPILGRVTNIDGGYILVRPKYQRYECEFYRTELKHIK